MAELKQGSTVGGAPILTSLDTNGLAVVIKTPVPVAPLTGTPEFNVAGVLDANAYSNAYTDARQHRVFEVSDDVGFSNIVFTASVDADSVTINPNLTVNTGYWWRCKDVSVAGDESRWSEVQAFVTGSIFVATPTLTVEGTPSDVPEQPVLTGSAFVVSGGSDTHVSADWEVRLSADDSLVWSSIGDSSNLTSITLPAGILLESTSYKFRVRYNSASFGSSAWAETVATTSDAFFVFDSGSAGLPLEGGYYAGQINSNGTTYALIVAPRAQGGQSSSKLTWKTAQTATTGTDSLHDGVANTAAMIAAGAANHPAADFCNSLNINGYTDWYLPAKDELEILYRYLKPTTQSNNTSHGANTNAIPPTGNYTSGDPSQTSVAIFQAGGGEDFATDDYHWSSTQFSSTNAWNQYFDNGNQKSRSKTNTYWVRAVRRVAV